MAASAALFDLDGTLWDSWPWYAALVGRGEPWRVEQTKRALRAGRPIASLLRNAGITESQLRAACRAGACELYPGVPDTLRTLQKRGTRLGVVTNLPGWIAVPMLEELGLSIHFDAVAHYATAHRCKPHPDQLLAVLEQLGERPSSELWYVGDTAVDFQACRSAGLSFAWAAYGYGTPSDQDNATATVIERFDQALEL